MTTGTARGGGDDPPRAIEAGRNAGTLQRSETAGPAGPAGRVLPAIDGRDIIPVVYRAGGVRGLFIYLDRFILPAISI